MATAIITTLSGSTSNSYASVGDGDSYASERLRSEAWSDAATTDKTSALIQACERLQAELYVGVRVSFSQRLQFPRYGLFTNDGIWIDSNTIPDVVKRAQIELANVMLSGDDFNADTGLEGFKDVGVGPLSVTPNNARKAGTLPVSVMRFIGFLMVNQGGRVPLIRG